MPAANLTIDDLLFHSENPRIGSVSSQRDALQKILDEQEDKLAELAESIATDGMSPIERILVRPEKPEGKRFVVMEGNRRLAALKLLTNPGVLTSMSVASALQKRFEALAKDFDRSTVEPLACFESADEVETNKWIYLRHTGENKGRGVVPWSAIASRRFMGTDPALQALELVKSYGNLDEKEKVLLGDSFPITTLERLLDTKDVREVIGVDVKDRKLRTGLPGDELMKPLRRMVMDLATKQVNVSKLKNKAAQLEYVKGFGAEDKPNLKKISDVREIADFKANEFKSTAKPKPTKKSYDPSDRLHVVPRGLRLNVSKAKVAEIFGELKSLRMDDHPNACAVLLRVFLELSLESYMRTNSIDTQFKDPRSGRILDKDLKNKLQVVISDLVTKGAKKKDFEAVARAVNDKASPLYIRLLHGYVHSLFQTPKVRDLRLAWDEAEPLFEGIWK